MAWYRAGSVTVTNGSPNVVAAGTDFVSNTQSGEAFLGPDGRAYEVANVVSATQLTLAGPYLGGTAGGQGYALMPTSSFARDLALGAAELLNTFAAVRDGPGQGLFPDGSAATPAIRFASDQDTGLRRLGPNSIALVSGGQDILTAGSYIGIGTSNPLQKLHINNSTTDPTFALVGNNNNGLAVGVHASGFPTLASFAGSGFSFSAGLGGALTEFGRFDSSGNLLVGMSSGSYHVIAKNVAQGSALFRALTTGDSGQPSIVLAGVVAYSPNGSGAALYAGHHSVSGRSINAGGTINASGADYAEYMTKAAGCGTIAAGDVAGVDADGHLTKTWADAVSFVIKSTDPAYVGGDTWAQHMGSKPEQPGPEPNEPAPIQRVATEDDASFAARVAIHAAAVSAYPQLKADHDAAMAAYQHDLAIWEAELEAARQTVDRIAFAGQVPVNMTGSFAVGDYLIAAASGAGIKAVAVAAADITFDQYRRRLGKVWAIRDDRPWADVQHG